MVADEMHRRFGERTQVSYLDAGREDVRSEHADTVTRISEQGLTYPVTVVDGELLSDGSVSYLAIVRAVMSRLGPEGA